MGLIPLDGSCTSDLLLAQSAILRAKTDAELIAAVSLVDGEEQWEEQPDLYDW